jgi:hypothetical protein
MEADHEGWFAYGGGYLRIPAPAGADLLMKICKTAPTGANLLMEADHLLSDGPVRTVDSTLQTYQK